ncbi:biotin synthetase [Escherichia coli]|nr:biotin synthetase [Escherichia coli]
MPGWITTTTTSDTSPEFYGNIITTRTYQERLDTLEKCEKLGLKSVQVALWGLGETVKRSRRIIAATGKLADAAGKRANQHAGEGERHAAGG